MIKDIGLRGASRRDFVRGVFAASAALGLGPARAIDMLEKMGGSALADVATPNLVVNVVMGNGGLSRFSQVVPTPMVIEQPNAMYAIDDVALYKKIDLANGNPLYHRMIAGQPIFANKPWTAFVSGQSQAHSNFSAFNNNTANINTGGSVQMFSAASALQNTLGALVPSIGVGAPNYAPGAGGAPAPAIVANQQALLGLFSSAASQLMTRLQPAANQALFQQYYTAFLGLATWSDKPTYSRAKGDAKVALSLVVKNLASQLAPKAGQAAAMAPVNTLVSTDAKFTSLANLLIVAGNAFKLGLTAQVTFLSHTDDPHGHFAKTQAQYTGENDSLAQIFDSFQKDMSASKDMAGKNLGDRVLITVTGDTTKNHFQRNGWPDGAAGGSNILYVQGQGRLQPGWFGTITPNARQFANPTTGKPDAAIQVGQGTSQAAGAFLAAVADGKTDLVRPFYSGALDAFVNKNLLG